MAITRAQQYRQMLKNGKIAMQGGVKNYLGKKKMVTVPKDWQSGPDHPKTELAYITKAEKDLLIKKDLHNSLNGKPNRGPGGVMSLNGWGDKGDTSDRSYGGGNVSGAGDNKDYSGYKDTGTGNYQKSTNQADIDARIEYEKAKKERERQEKIQEQVNKYNQKKVEKLKSFVDKDILDLVSEDELDDVNVTDKGIFGNLNDIRTDLARKTLVNSIAQKLGAMPKSYVPSVFMSDMVRSTPKGITTDSLTDMLSPDFDMGLYGISGKDLTRSQNQLDVAKQDTISQSDFDSVYGNKPIQDTGGDGDTYVPPIIPQVASTVDQEPELSELQKLLANRMAYRFMADGGRAEYQDGSPAIDPRMARSLQENVATNEAQRASNQSFKDMVVQGAQQNLQRHFANNELLRDAVNRGELSRQDYNKLGGYDYTQNVTGGEKITGGLTNLLGSPVYNLIQAFKGEQDFSPILGTALRNAQGGFGMISDDLKSQYENIVNPQTTATNSGAIITDEGRQLPIEGNVEEATNFIKSLGLSSFDDYKYGPYRFKIDDNGSVTYLGSNYASGGRAGFMGGGITDIDLVGGLADGSMDEMGRQMYGLGKLVKKATRAVKKIVKSPVGKAALAFGAYKLGGGLLKNDAIKSFLFAGKDPAFANLTGKGILAGIGGISALSGLMAQPEEDEDEQYYRGEGLDIAKIRANPYDYMGPAYRFRAAEGGNAEPVAKDTMPLLDMNGMEKDYRADGGFVPIGRMERADDVPARLSKNEFVFTADAVRNAGDGDVDKGAEVMYNMMKNLESGGKVSEESQGLDGARNMFQTSKRLEEVL